MTWIPPLDIRKLDVLMHGRKVGVLTATQEGLAAFQYDREWLADGFSISPLSLPLENRTFIADSYTLDGLFGIFDDSLPDGWGRLLVDRMLLSHGIDPYDVGFLTRLAIVGKSGSGALEYQPAADVPPAYSSYDLDEIADECALVLAAKDTGDLDTLFMMGGSSGGARPKIFYMIDGEEWIVKFPSSVDPKTIGADEYALARAASACGIEIPEVKLLPSNTCDGYFATKRFDRVHLDDGSTRRIHMASVAALLETSHRIPNLDYDLLMRLTLKITGSLSEMHKMYALMVFNVLCGNRDDHSKNFTFICKNGTWCLSPAYDLTNNHGMNGERATTVHGKGRDITDEDMILVAKEAGIPLEWARNTIDRTRSVLDDVRRQ